MGVSSSQNAKTQFAFFMIHFSQSQRDTPQISKKEKTADKSVRGTRAVVDYCSFAYSVFASLRMGTSGSASFHVPKKSW